MGILMVWLRRLVMVLLLAGALAATFEAVSGVKARELTAGILHSYISHTDKGGPFRIFGLVEKTLPAKHGAAFMSSASVKGQAEEINWNEYPKHKVTATGYTAGYESTGKNPGHPEYGITYSGVKVKRDLFSTIAADLNVFPIGTVLYIPDYGYGIVTDKGSAIKGDELDLYFDTVEEVYKNWGKKELDVFILKRGDGKFTEQELVQLNKDSSMQVFRQKYLNQGKEL